MGLSKKPFGKFGIIMKKLDNELVKKKEDNKKEK